MFRRPSLQDAGFAGLRQLIGFESVPDEFDVSGDLDYQPVRSDLRQLKGSGDAESSRLARRARRRHRRT